MDTSFYVLVVFQIVLIISLAFILYAFLKLILNNNLENRFKDYSLTSSIDETVNK